MRGLRFLPASIGERSASYFGKEEGLAGEVELTQHRVFRCSIAFEFHVGKGDPAARATAIAAALLRQEATRLEGIGENGNEFCKRKDCFDRSPHGHWKPDPENPEGECYFSHAEE